MSVDNGTRNLVFVRSRAARGNLDRVQPKTPKTSGCDLHGTLVDENKNRFSYGITYGCTRLCDDNESRRGVRF